MDSYEHPLYKEGDSEDRSAKVTWSDAIQYCIKRSESECLEQCYRETDSGYDCDWNANGYRLPTEAEFNYAAPNFIRRLSARPDSFPEKDEKKPTTTSSRILGPTI
jgi:formylglycine-generating enzyme required for sulfatase activity